MEDPKSKVYVPENAEKKARFEAAVSLLEQLVKKEGDGNVIATITLSWFMGNGFLTPKQAFTMLWRLDENKIPYPKGCFPVSLTSKKYKRDMREMTKQRVEKIWDCLSTAQKDWYRRLQAAGLTENQQGLEPSLLDAIKTKADPIVRRIYLAGKVAKNDWRTAVVPGLREFLSVDEWQEIEGDISRVHLSLKVMNRFVYTGPFFVSCDHGCYHNGFGYGHPHECEEIGAHGVGSNTSARCNGELDSATSHKQVLANSLYGIDRADTVFAWIDDLSLYGTLAEIGYARGRGKHIIVAVKNDFDDRDMWLAKEMASRVIESCETPREALELI
jgi:hypothetical protein